MVQPNTMAIQTFVFFDLETTGIPANQAKVIEITLMSVSRRDIERADCKNLPPINKLSFLCNPEKDVQRVAAKITGLTNEFLANQPVFKNIINCLNSFLDMPKPVCLVAHNGNLFDFKILQAEYKNANGKLPHDLVCVDSLNAFRNILKARRDCTNVNNDSTVSLDESDRAQNEEQWLDLSNEEIQEIDELIETFSEITTAPKNKRNKKENNTITPKREKTPRVSYKLCDIYERLLNKKVKECHRAEVDCIMLLECVVATKKDFLAYADSNQKLLSDIKS